MQMHKMNTTIVKAEGSSYSGEHREIMECQMVEKDIVIKTESLSDNEYEEQHISPQSHNVDDKDIKTEDIKTEGISDSEDTMKMIDCQ